MRVSRQIPWRKLRTVVIVCVLLVALHTLWEFSGSADTVSENSIGSSKYVLKANGLLPHIVRKSQPKTNVCKKIVPFKDSSSGVISTFDLPDETDYSLNEKGRYKIPQEFYDAEEEPLEESVEVILVPFSHADPGYGMTFEGYYTQRIKNALDNMVEHLTQYRNMTFQWAETVFLERWFQDLSSDGQEKVRELIVTGQLEIMLGGWVMPDEASTHYQAVIDQLIEGHQWIAENLGVKPVNAWINDPFGYSSTMPYLWKKSGIENMVILRIHQAIKSTLMRKRAMDFKWRPYWNGGSDVNDILCNLMPYPGYWNGDVCSPDQDICKQFNFLHLRQYNDGVEINDANIAEQATKLYKAYKFTSSLYQYRTLVIFLGEDNSYDTMSSFTDTNSNYGKLIRFINAKKEWKMNIQFGTARDYFENIRRVESVKKAKIGPQLQFPTLSGDFFPYSDFENDTWTGYYTTRMWMKRFTREIEPIIRAADVFSVLGHLNCLMDTGEGKCDETTISVLEKNIINELRIARRNVGMFQHHDGITGTSLTFVVDDYEFRLLKAFTSARKALVMSLQMIATRGNVRDQTALQDNFDKNTPKDILSPTYFRLAENKTFIVVNPLEKPRQDVVSFYVENTDITFIDANGITTDFQVSAAKSAKYQNKYLLTLPVFLLPYQVATFRVELGNRINMKNKTRDTTTKGGDSEIITIKNEYMKVDFNVKSGFLESITDSEGRTTMVKSDFFKYIPDKSGAYLFGPKGPAETISSLHNSKPDISVEIGPVYSQVRVAYSLGFIQKFTLYHFSDVKARGLHVSNEIDLSVDSTFDNTEVVWRFKTDVQNGDLFFADQNGFQFLGRRTYRSRPIETNFYPMTSMAFIEDEKKRLVVHSAQPHGVASLEEGWLEIMVDRNAHRDDKKGLGTGTFEKVNTLTEFIIHIEYKDKPEPIPEPRFTFPSAESMILNELLQNKVHLVSVERNQADFKYALTPRVPEFPCDLSVVGMRFLAGTHDYKVTNVSLVVHRKPVHCSFTLKAPASCSVCDKPLTMRDFMKMFTNQYVTHGSDVSLFNKGSLGYAINVLETVQRPGTMRVHGKIKETSLSHLHDIETLELDSDLRPEPGELRSYCINVK